MRLLRSIDLKFDPFTVKFCHTTATPTFFVSGYDVFTSKNQTKLSWHGLQGNDTIIHLENQTNKTPFVCPSPHEPFVLFGGDLGIRSLNLQTGEITNPLPEFEVVVTSCIAHPDKNVLFVSGFEQLWRIDLDLKQVGHLGYDNPALSSFHPFTDTFFYTCSDESSGRSYVVFQKINDSELHQESYVGVSIAHLSGGGFHPQGTHYVLLADLVRVFEYPSHRQVCAFDATGEFFESPWEELVHKQNLLVDGASWFTMHSLPGVPWGNVVFNHSGEELYCATPSGRILHVDWVQQRWLGSTVAHEKRVTQIAMSKDGKYLASIGRPDQTLKVWQLFN